jgi:hypothetical protein
VRRAVSSALRDTAVSLARVPPPVNGRAIVISPSGTGRHVSRAFPITLRLVQQNAGRTIDPVRGDP